MRPVQRHITVQLRNDYVIERPTDCTAVLECGESLVDSSRSAPVVAHLLYDLADNLYRYIGLSHAILKMDSFCHSVISYPPASRARQKDTGEEGPLTAEVSALISVPSD